MALASQSRSSNVTTRLRRRQLRRLSAELARLETAAKAARGERQRLEHASAVEAGGHGPDGGLSAQSEEGLGAEAADAPADGASRADQLLAAARRREQALRIAIGDCRAEIFKALVRGGRWERD